LAHRAVHLGLVDASASTSTAVLLGLVVLALLGALALLTQPMRLARSRRRLRAQPFPAAWRDILRRHVPLVARLPAPLQLRLKRHIQVFIAEKPFIGCQGQQIDDEVRVTIAAQACLLLLGDERAECFPRLRQVLVYPDVFLVHRERSLGAGLVQALPQALAGESWSQGQVVLAWSQVLLGAADANDGRNVVVHEFAHQIDQDKGVADGRPWRHSRRAGRRWDAVMTAEFLRVQQAGVTQAEQSIDGADDPAELFAVLSEHFIERAGALAAEAPAAHRQLVELYGFDPADW
jgi:Mlc titration factor MtfA (ptsG expression regulator)